MLKILPGYSILYLTRLVVDRFDNFLVLQKNVSILEFLHEF